MLLRLLTARLGNREDAEDAAQEMWLKLDDVGGGVIDHPAAYLYRMAANLASDRRASAMSSKARDSAWAEVQPGAEELPDAERSLIARDRLQRIENALKTLPDRTVIAFRMFRVEGAPQKAIAKTLGISVSGVEKLLQRAYRQIHDASIGEETGSPHRLGHMKDVES